MNAAAVRGAVRVEISTKALRISLTHSPLSIGNVNGIWGDPIFNGEIASGTKIRKDYTYKIKENFKDLEYAVVAYLMNADTYEVLQVIMVEP